ncbi:hypothetical protein IP92_04709 [Pseudoduganella flava]|nr:hypothetical protein IP92_04709 [Pseudoduganella flava]
MSPNRSLRLGATLLLSFSSLPALAGRPLVTDDASVVAPGMCQVEMSAQRDPGQGWFIPACNVANDWEVGAGFGGVRHEGAWRRALAVHAKTLFRPLTEDGWGAGVTFAQQQLTGLNGAQEGLRDRSATLILSIPIASWAIVHANVGGIEHRAAGHGARTWATALETTHGHTGLSLETFGERGAYRTWQAGWRWSAVPDVLDLDAAWGVQHCDGVRANYAVLGLTWTFPR